MAGEKMNNKIDFIKKNLKKNTEYIPDKKDKFLKKIIIGELDSPPHSKYVFFENGKFECKNIDTGKTYKGLWKLNGGELSVKTEKMRTWEIIIVKRYYLEYMEENNYYNFYIDTDKPFPWDGSQSFMLQFK